jgi:hypothetical protein
MQDDLIVDRASGVDGSAVPVEVATGARTRGEASESVNTGAMDYSCESNVWVRVLG